MSPRAAARLVRLGFDAVHDYVGGKADWMAAGLPTVRRVAQDRRAIEAATLDVPTCLPSTPVSELPAGAVVVLDETGVVLGRVPADRRDGPAAEDVMQAGPSTVRAHEPLEQLRQRMAARNVAQVLVTTPEGRFLGAVGPSDG